MEHMHIPLPPLASPGEVTSFYAYEGGAARNAMLSALALHLASARAGEAEADRRDRPVLMIDWDLDAPALHRHLDLPPAGAGVDGARGMGGTDAEADCQPDVEADHQAHHEADGEAAASRPGLIEFFEACRGQLRRETSQRTGAGQDDALAERVLDAVDWRSHVERADQRRPLYLMRAGRFDDSYAARAGRFDWEALFDACPALFRRFAARMARHFSHVLVASRPGRSPAVSVCTTLLADRLVGLFTPAPGSLEGFEGVVRRAIDYRCTHEDEQRPLLVYPLACAPDGARSDPQQRWRRGDARVGAPGYQPRIEALLRACYGWPRVNLDSYFDELQLPLADAMSTAGPGTDRRALARLAGVLAEWVAPGRFPWQSLDEIRLRAAVARARFAQSGAESGAESAANARGLADGLARLGALCRRDGRFDEARACLDECLALRERSLEQDHPLVRSARAAMAQLLLEAGLMHEARRQYELLAQSCVRSVGGDDAETLSARSRLACALAGLGEAERALALHEQVVAACERALGAAHPATLDSLEDLAASLARQHEYGRARIVCERVLDGRRRLLGAEHEATLRCGQRLAHLLGEMGELGNARRLLEAVLRARERHDGADASGTLGAREALAEILAAQGDLAAVRSIQESLARTRERHLGAGHPETLDMQLRLASTLGQQGETEAARRLREQVTELRRHLEQAEGGDPSRAGGEGRQKQEPGQLRAGIGKEGEGAQVSDSLGHKLAQLQNLIDSRSPREARALADRLRNSVLKPSVADPLRRRGAAMIKQVYLQDGDKDALLSFTQDEVSSLEGALIEALREHPLPLR